ncbi:MAG TPA: hypothetical protein VFN77_00555, partial [Acetobacteraceae bacterium]|nr:hypothetical protein [Acetobacteraceae bacterium]
MLAVPKNFADQKYYDQHPYEVDLAHVGQGNWRAFRALGISLQEVVQIAEGWKAVFSGITRPWLCWNVDDDWSLVQQKII